jgi:hypothetical protein
LGWNHRVFKTVGDPGFGENCYEIREVYYSNNGYKLNGWTQDAITPYGDSLESLEWVLEKMLEAVRDCKKNPNRLLSDKICDEITTKQRPFPREMPSNPRDKPRF